MIETKVDTFGRVINAARFQEECKARFGDLVEAISTGPGWVILHGSSAVDPISLQALVTVHDASVPDAARAALLAEWSRPILSLGLPQLQAAAAAMTLAEFRTEIVRGFFILREIVRRSVDA